MQANGAVKPDFHIGEWIVRPGRSCIERYGDAVHVAPKAMAVLTCLAEAQGRVVARQEIFEAVWPGCVVTDDALTQRVSELRKAFGDSPRHPAVIETVPKIGFRLIPLPAPLDASTNGDVDAPAGRRVLRTPARWGVGIAAGLALAFGYLVWSVFDSSGEERAAVAGGTQSVQASPSPESHTRGSETPPVSTEAYWSLIEGRAALREGTPDSIRKAIEHYENAVKLDPRLARAYLEMADAYWLGVEQRSTPDTEAISRIDEYARKALSLDPDLGPALAHLGHVKRIAGRHAEAESLFRRALELEPRNAEVLHGLGLTLRLQGRAPEAVAYYDRAIKFDPFSPIINESRGSLLRDLGRFDEAEKQYLKTVEIAPGFVLAYWGLGTLYWSIGRPDQAVAWFEDAVRLAPHGDVFRTWLALMHLELGQDEHAEAVIEDARRVARIEAENDIALAEELLRIFRGEDTSDLPDGRRFMFRYWYGRLLDLPIRPLLEGRFADTIAEYERRFPGISSNEGVVDATNLQAAIYVAHALVQLDRRKQALRLLDEAEAHLRDLPRLGLHGYWVMDAQIQAVRGNYADSLQRLEVAVDQGWRNVWRLYLSRDPVLETLQTRPGYDALMTRVRTDMTDRVSPDQKHAGL